MDFLTILLIALSTGNTAPATQPASAPAGFLEAKTFFQTNLAYDPRIAMPVDAVVIHRHGHDPASLKAVITSWKDHGYVVGRMFFADSDPGWTYTRGKWDGRQHPEDVEQDASGQQVLCAGERPYMLPTDGWTRYLEDMTRRSIEAGADAILPEEPLAHVNTGYEASFRTLWQEHYGTPWQPPDSSPAAHFMSARLKGELYRAMLGRLAEVTAQESRRRNRDIPLLLPIHCLYSNVAAGLVAPLGTSVNLQHVDGYVGQIWTGPVNWAKACYDSPRKSFFGSAYALYDYFVQLTAGTGKRLWLLTDPVEDDPRHSWADFQRWYRECVAAELLFPEADRFEVMPWPERIFLPGNEMAGGTPAPAEFRIVILSVLQAMQDMPRRGGWEKEVTPGLGVAVSDSLMWQSPTRPPLQSIYGMLMPLIESGVPVSACVLERAAEPDYLARFRVIALSYEVCKPPSAKTHDALAAWVRGGGALLVLGADDRLNGPFWRSRFGNDSPTAHLLKTLGASAGAEQVQSIGKGSVIRWAVSPRSFKDSALESRYIQTLGALFRRAAGSELRTPGAFQRARGEFVVAHAFSKPLTIPGRYVDAFDPDLAVKHDVTLQPGSSALLRRFAEVTDDAGPLVLHTTHRLMSVHHNAATMRLVMRGPAETPAVARLFTAGRKVAGVQATAFDGSARTVEVKPEGDTLRLRFLNDPQGVSVSIEWN